MCNCRYERFNGFKNLHPCKRHEPTSETMKSLYAKQDQIFESIKKGKLKLFTGRYTKLSPQDLKVFGKRG